METMVMEVIEMMEKEITGRAMRIDRVYAASS